MGSVRNSKRTQKSIVDTAMVLFAKNGFDGVSVDLIAKEAGINKAMIYYYFKNKAKGKSAQDYLEVKEKGKKRKNYRADKLEKEILNYGNPEEDPFKLIKVSDLRAINGVKTQIVYAVNRKKTGERARGPYQILEVIEAGAEFEGKIIFMEEFLELMEYKRESIR